MDGMDEVDSAEAGESSSGVEESVLVSMAESSNFFSACNCGVDNCVDSCDGDGVGGLL